MMPCWKKHCVQITLTNPKSQSFRNGAKIRQTGIPKQSKWKWLNLLAKWKRSPLTRIVFFNMLSDLSNLEKVQDRIPEDKIKDFDSTKTLAVFPSHRIDKITFQIVEREPNKTIKSRLRNSPVPCPLDSTETGGRERHTDETDRSRRTESVYQTNGIKIHCRCDR